MKILVTGGAGYIGSITAKLLQKQGHDVVVFDNLEYGHKEAVSARLIEGDLIDKEFLNESLKGEKFDGIIHFAAYALAGESMKNPYKYFHGNIIGGLNLLEYMKDEGIKDIIFSSSCAVYGMPKKLPVTETEDKKPESVYGESKLMFENVLKWYADIFDIRYVNLRYFNAAGGSLDGLMGEGHNPETHIIPLAIKSALNNTPFHLFGNDYETPDGTCIRDYIHVEDLAKAHVLALEYLQKEGKSDSINLGTGQGYSNLQVIETIKEVSGVDFPIENKPRRPGDPAAIYADNTKAKEKLGFETDHSDLETIVKTAWEWHRKQNR